MYQISAYFKFLWRSTNQHGVHSPFVYNLVTRCFYDKKNYPSYDLLARYRKSLLQNTSTIQVKDFGAGSRVFNSSERKVADIARLAGISPHRAKLLNRLVKYLKVGRALELGTSLGLGSAALAFGNSIKVTTVEGCPATGNLAQKEFRKSGLDNILLMPGNFHEILSSLKDKTTYDLVYFDGNHQKEPTLDYFRRMLPYASNDSVFIFDDIHWSREMTEAWEEIKSHPSVTVTIDTFKWGMVFFRKQQEKEHFTIRI